MIKDFIRRDELARADGSLRSTKRRDVLVGKPWRRIVVNEHGHSLAVLKALAFDDNSPVNNLAFD